MAAKTGIILYVHGARDPRWSEPFHRLREKVAARAPASPVVVAFLEHGKPNLAEAAAAMAAEDVIRIRVVPLVVGRGGHLREDFPRQLDAARAAAPSVEFEVTEAAGENDAVLNALAAFAVIELGALSIHKVTH
ncbi:MAG: CbiX/SirB N-terminal domain-containing protein [Casimicrobiaceae bacterium]